jgi:phosphohistidine phosphatase
MVKTEMWDDEQTEWQESIAAPGRPDSKDEMEIYILRHGIAEPRRPGRADAKRALTDRGRVKLREVLARARAAKVAPSLILTSPYVRAVQTAEIAAEVLGRKGILTRTDALLPSSSPEAVWREILGHADEDAILLAGHEPLLSEAATYLLGAERTVIELKKGALVSIDLEELHSPPQGVLKWLLTPKLAAGKAEEEARE